MTLSCRQGCSILRRTALGIGHAYPWTDFSRLEPDVLSTALASFKQTDWCWMCADTLDTLQTNWCKRPSNQVDRLEPQSMLLVHCPWINYVTAVDRAIMFNFIHIKYLPTDFDDCACVISNSTLIYKFRHKLLWRYVHLNFVLFRFALT